MGLRVMTGSGRPPGDYKPYLGSEEQAPRHAVILLAVVQLVRDGDALQVGDLRDGAHREPPVHEAVVDEHVAHAEQRDAQARAEAQPCARLVWGAVRLTVLIWKL